MNQERDLLINYARYGLTDIDLTTDCYLWELGTILESLVLRELDKQEQNVVLGFNLRYTLNAKRP